VVVNIKPIAVTQNTFLLIEAGLLPLHEFLRNSRSQSSEAEAGAYRQQIQGFLLTRSCPVRRQQVPDPYPKKPERVF